MTMHYLPKKATLLRSVLALLLATLFGSVSGGNQLRGGAAVENLVRSDESSSTSSSLFSSSTVDEDDADNRVLKPSKRRNRKKRNKKNKSAKSAKATKVPKENKSKSAKKNPKKDKSEPVVTDAPTAAPSVAVVTDSPTAAPTADDTINVGTDSPTVAPTPTPTFVASAVAYAACEQGEPGCDAATLEAAYKLSVEGFIFPSSRRLDPRKLQTADPSQTTIDVVVTSETCNSDFPVITGTPACWEIEMTITSTDQTSAENSVQTVEAAVDNGDMTSSVSTAIPSIGVGPVPSSNPTVAPTEEPSEAPSEEPSETPTAS